MSASVLNLEIVDKIGSGGMGIVYLAYLVGADGFKKKVIAKKVKDDGFKSKLLSEAKLHAQLSHPNISQVIDIRSLKGDDYIVSEFVEGNNLKQLISTHRQSNQPIPGDVIEKIFWQLVSALKYLHSKNIVHGDLTPANIMISDDYHVKVIDFGLAIETIDYEKTTYTENISGTAEYISPERIDKQKATKSSDVFSLGVILFEMVTLKNPFKSESLFKTLEAIKKLDVFETTNFSEDRFLKICRNLLIKDPKIRPSITEIEKVGDLSEIKDASFFKNKILRSLGAVTLVFIISTIAIFVLQKKNKAKDQYQVTVIRNSIPSTALSVEKFTERSVNQCHFFYNKLHANIDLLFREDGRRDFVDSLHKGNFYDALSTLANFFANNRDSMGEMFKMCDREPLNKKMIQFHSASVSMLSKLLGTKVDTFEKAKKADFTDELMTRVYSGLFAFPPYDGYSEQLKFTRGFVKNATRDSDLIPEVLIAKYDQSEKEIDKTSCRNIASYLWLNDRIFSVFNNYNIFQSYHVLIVPSNAKINKKENSIFIDVQDSSNKVCEFIFDGKTEERISLY